MGLSWMTQRTIRIYVKKREPFKLDNIWATWFLLDETPDFGRLSLNNINQLKSDISTQGAVYVVYSYETPIGWTRSADLLDWYIPSDTYSNTTSHHQNVLIDAISAQ